MQPTPRAHYAPRRPAGGDRDFSGGLHAVLRCGRGAPRQADAPPEARDHPWAHKRIAVYGERGHAIWSMWSWETLCAGRLERGRHDYWEQDGPAQGGPGRLRTGLDRTPRAPAPAGAGAGRRTVRGCCWPAYRSALRRRRLALPEAAQPPVIEPIGAGALSAAEERRLRARRGFARRRRRTISVLRASKSCFPTLSAPLGRAFHPDARPRAAAALLPQGGADQRWTGTPVTACNGCAADLFEHGRGGGAISSCLYAVDSMRNPRRGGGAGAGVQRLADPMNGCKPEPRLRGSDRGAGPDSRAGRGRDRGAPPNGPDSSRC